jgi:hypothetical protein
MRFLEYVSAGGKGRFAAQDDLHADPFAQLDKQVIQGPGRSVLLTLSGKYCATNRRRAPSS